VENEPEARSEEKPQKFEGSAVNWPEIWPISVHARSASGFFHNDFHSCGNLGGHTEEDAPARRQRDGRRPANVAQEDREPGVRSAVDLAFSSTRRKGNMEETA
jgi:hypothetical protein